jgi:hypothetical protein
LELHGNLTFFEAGKKFFTMKRLVFHLKVPGLFKVGGTIVVHIRNGKQLRGTWYPSVLMAQIPSQSASSWRAAVAGLCVVMEWS